MMRFPHVLAVILLGLMAVLAGGAALRESITVDEVAHIGAGVSYLQKLDMRMNQEHPPLAKVLSAIPLVLRGVRADYSDVSWPFSNRGWGNMLGEWSWGHSLALRWNDPYLTVAWARVPMLLLTLILGLYVYLCAAELGAGWGGVLCLVAFVTTPAFLVFGSLVVTDVAVTLFCLLAMWRFASLWRTPSRRNMVVFGLLLGAAFLSKFSSGLLLFGFLTFRLSLRFTPLPECQRIGRATRVAEAAWPLHGDGHSDRRGHRVCRVFGAVLESTNRRDGFCRSWHGSVNSSKVADAVDALSPRACFLRRGLDPDGVYSGMACGSIFQCCLR